MRAWVTAQNAGTSRTEEQPVTEAHRVDEINLSEKFQSIGVGDPKRRWLVDSVLPVTSSQSGGCQVIRCCIVMKSAFLS